MPGLSFRAAMTTTGTAAPGFEEELDQRPYRYRGIEGWRPDNPGVWGETAPPTVGGDNSRRTQARQERMRVFAGALAEGLAAGLPRSRAIREAGRRVNVQPKTARDYAARLAAEPGAGEAAP